MSEAVRDIVIVGGGLSGWYCAARVCHAMRGRQIKVRVVHAAAPGAEPDPLDVFCASTMPALAVAHAELGIDERAFMRECHAGFKLATEYRGFADPARSYMLPFGEIGARLEAVGFHQFISRMTHAGRPLDIDEFSVPALAARLGRFAHPSQDARSVLSTYEYAYHLDTQAYTRLLRAFAERAGAVAIDGELARVVCNDGRQIEALVLADGTRVAGEWFIDCTGSSAALLGKALGVPFDSWQQWLPCDRAVVARTPVAEPPATYTRISAEPGGWVWQVPLRGMLEQALVFDSSRVDADAALRQASLMQAAGARTLRFANGRHRELWRGNCVALGAAAGFLEPLAATGLSLIEDGVSRLISLFPDRGAAALMATEYNRAVGAAYDGARDYVLLHYLFSRRAGAPWGRDHAAPLLPATLARRIEQFRHRGRVVLHDDEIFEEPEWACAFVGLGERPAHFSILAEQMNDADMLAQIAKIARVMQSAAQKLPSHQAYLERYLA